jgi:hypothetical protein
VVGCDSEGGEPASDFSGSRARCAVFTRGSVEVGGRRSCPRVGLVPPVVTRGRPPCGTATLDCGVRAPEIEDELFDAPALVCVTVETGDARLGRADGAGSPEPAPDPGWAPLLVCGTDSVAEGTDGTVTPGTVTPGTVTPGTVTPGTVTPGTVTPGTVTPGTVTPGTVTPGTVTPGTVSAVLARGSIQKIASSASPRAAMATIRRAARVGRPAIDDSGRMPIRAVREGFRTPT